MRLHRYTNDNTDNLLDTLVDKMENCLHNLKNLPRPTIMYGIKNNLLILYIILVVQFFILAAVSMSTVAWIIVFIFMILSILAIRNKFRNKGNETSQQLEQIINEYETYQRQANTYFGKDKEVKNLSQTLTQELDAIRKERKNKHSDTIFPDCYSFLVFLLLPDLPYFLYQNLSQPPNYQ